MFTERYLAMFTIERSVIPTMDQLMATAERLGAKTDGSAFAALTAAGLDNWIAEADQEHGLVEHIPAQEFTGPVRGSEERLLRALVNRRQRLPLFG